MSGQAKIKCCHMGIAVVDKNFFTPCHNILTQADQSWHFSLRPGVLAGKLLNSPFKHLDVTHNQINGLSTPRQMHYPRATSRSCNAEAKCLSLEAYQGSPIPPACSQWKSAWETCQNALMLFGKNHHNICLQVLKQSQNVTGHDKTRVKSLLANLGHDQKHH